MTNFSDPSSVKMANISGVINIILNISWMEQSNVDHYEVQIDDHHPIPVKTTTFLTIQESNIDSNHTVQLRAVDSCDRKSDTTVVRNITLPVIASAEQEHNPVASGGDPVLPSTDEHNDEANSGGKYCMICI